MEKADWHVTTATVSDCVYRGRDRKGRHRYAVGFDYRVDGKRYSDQFLSLKSKEPESTFPLRYDPSDPAAHEWVPEPPPPGAALQKWAGPILWTMLALVLGSLFVWYVVGRAILLGSHGS